MGSPMSWRQSSGAAGQRNITCRRRSESACNGIAPACVVANRDHFLNGDQHGREQTDGGRGQGGKANQDQGTSEGLVGQATETVRNVASSAADLAQNTYERGARYAREGWESLPDVGRYS